MEPRSGLCAGQSSSSAESSKVMKIIYFLLGTFSLSLTLHNFVELFLLIFQGIKHI